MIPAPIADHPAEAVALLTDAHRNQVNTPAILRAMCKRYDRLEAFYWEVIDKRLLDDAVGEQLDFLGDLVGEARNGRVDTRFRAAIRLRIHVNQSKGRVSDIIRFAVLTGAAEIQYSEGGTASFTLRLYGIDAPLDIAALLKRARPAGVQASLEWASSPTGYARFGWEGDPTIGTPGVGYEGSLVYGLPAGDNISA